MLEKIRMKELNKWSNYRLKKHIIFLEKELEKELVKRSSLTERGL